MVIGECNGTIFGLVRYKDKNISYKVENGEILFYSETKKEYIYLDDVDGRDIEHIEQHIYDFHSLHDPSSDAFM